MKLLTYGLSAFAVSAAVTFGLSAVDPAYAQDAPEFAVAADAAFVFNTTLFLVAGFLVMFMAAGFCMLEAGLVRSKNVSMQCLKNIGLYSVAGIMFWLLGYNLMYEGVNGG
ncbi:MAG: ammonium transporter, partial [Pseudomonadota bacterium]